MPKSILIVDDDPTQRRLLEGVVKKLSYSTKTARSGEEAVSLIEKGKDGLFDLMLLDLVMPGMDGMAVMEAVRRANPALPVIVLTAQSGVDIIVKAMTAGARDFIVKPASPERLQVSIQNALSMNVLTGEIKRLTRKIQGEMTFDDLIAESPAMQKVNEVARRAAESNIPVLIEGESGVGKEMIARAIQGASDRAGRPFVAVNCGAIPENLVESLLFGHEKGAFTGASDKHVGKFREADGGTLFLDEIGELKPDIQVKLLRALQEKEIDPVGSKKPVKIDIRLISATNRSLEQMVKENHFREDLYYRLNVFPLVVPALRERREDVAPLARHFMQNFAATESKTVTGISPEAIELLENHPWKGNVRQLENAVFRAVVLADRETLSVDDFPQIVQNMTQSASADALNALRADTDTPANQNNRAQKAAAARDKGRRGAVNATKPVAKSKNNGREKAATGQGAARINPYTDDGEVRNLDDIEGELIRLALEQYDGQISKVANALGIGRSTLYRKLRSHGLDIDVADLVNPLNADAPSAEMSS